MITRDDAEYWAQCWKNEAATAAVRVQSTFASCQPHAGGDFADASPGAGAGAAVHWPEPAERKCRTSLDSDSSLDSEEGNR